MTGPKTIQLRATAPDDLSLASRTGLDRVFGDKTFLYAYALDEHASDSAMTDDTLCVTVNHGVPARALKRPEDARTVNGTHLLATPVAIDLTECTIQANLKPDFQAVIFDVDGTLVDSLKAYFHLAEQAAAHYGLPVGWPMIKSALNQNTLNFWQLIVPSDYVDRDAVIQDMQQRARDAWPQVLKERVKLMPTTESLVTALAHRRIKMGIVTSSGGDAMQPMHDAELTGHFASVVTRHDVTHRKPDPEGILKVLATLGVEPNKAAYVGDSIMDIRAAHNAGVTSIGVLCGSGDNTTLTAERPHYLFTDAAELVQLLG